MIQQRIPHPTKLPVGACAYTALQLKALERGLVPARTKPSAFIAKKSGTTIIIEWVKPNA